MPRLDIDLQPVGDHFTATILTVFSVKEQAKMECYAGIARPLFAATVFAPVSAESLLTMTVLRGGLHGIVRSPPNHPACIAYK